MRRWYTEIPVLREAFPDLLILSCHDEYLLPTMFDVDGLLVGYGNMAPEVLIELIAAGKAQDYPKARELHDKLLPLTKAVYHRGSHMEGTVALKHALVEAHPWIAMNLLKAFEQAKRASIARALDVTAPRFPIPWCFEHTRRAQELFGEDHWPYGVDRNRTTLEAFLQYAHEQGVCHRRLAPEELFPEQVLSRVRV